MVVITITIKKVIEREVHDCVQLKTNEDIYEYLKDNKDDQLVFFDFMSRIINRVLINLNINLPFSRNDIARKN